MVGVSMEYQVYYIIQPVCGMWTICEVKIHTICVWACELFKLMLKVRWALLWLREQVNCHNFSIMGTGHSLHVMHVNKEPDI